MITLTSKARIPRLFNNSEEEPIAAKETLPEDETHTLTSHLELPTHVITINKGSK